MMTPGQDGDGGAEPRLQVEAGVADAGGAQCRQVDVVDAAPVGRLDVEVDADAEGVRMTEGVGSAQPQRRVAAAPFNALVRPVH